MNRRGFFGFLAAAPLAAKAATSLEEGVKIEVPPDHDAFRMPHPKDVPFLYSGYVAAIPATDWEIQASFDGRTQLIVYNDDGTVRETIVDPARAKEFFKTLA